MAKSNWNASQIPNLTDKVIVITGSTSGIGKAAAKILSKKDATLVMAVRNLEKAEHVIAEIKSENPKAKIEARSLDLTSLSSIQQFAEDFRKDYHQLDVLINNAGIMMCPYSKTTDGFEIQMGTNHLGHFALSGYLMPLLKQTPNSRLVVTSSIGHKFGKIDLEDLNWEKRKYDTNKAYGDSKLANLYFTYELVRKLENDADAPLVVAAHPGWTKTELQRHTPGIRVLNLFFSQAPEMGILPSLRAAFDPMAQPGDFYGPSRFFEMHGNPVKVRSNQLSQDKEIAKKLWDLSEKMTGIQY